MYLVLNSPGGVTQSIPARGVLGLEQIRIQGQELPHRFQISEGRRLEKPLDFDFFRQPRSFFGSLQRQGIAAGTQDEQKQ